MRTIVTIILAFVSLSVAWAAPSKVTLDARNLPIKDAITQVSQQSGVSVVLDPKAKGAVTINLKDAELSQALDVIASPLKLTWKKLQFAKPNEDTVKLDQIKSGILALASMPMVAMSVEDPSTKTSAVFARNLSSSPDTANFKLPDGYSWATVYVVLAAEPAATASAAGSDKVKAMTEAEGKKFIEMANMTPEERQQVFAGYWAAQMSLAPETRRAVLRDQLQAMFNIDAQYRDQYWQDMHSVMRELRESGQMPERPRGNWGGGRHEE